MLSVRLLRDLRAIRRSNIRSTKGTLDIDHGSTLTQLLLRCIRQQSHLFLVSEKHILRLDAGDFRFDILHLRVDTG